MLEYVLDVVMYVSAGWYASGTFWSGAGVVVGVLGAIAAVWVAFAVGFPRRRLFYRMQAAAPLMAAPEGARGDLELRHRGKVLDDPRALTIELISRGRKDISNDAYNDDRPIRLDVGAPIVDLLQVASKPEGLPKPKVAIDGTAVNIGPSLISKHHVITITVLTDGGKPALSCESPLIDIDVRQGPGDPNRVVAVVLMFIAIAALAPAIPLELVNPANDRLATFLFLVGIISFGAGAVFAWGLKRSV